MTSANNMVLPIPHRRPDAPYLPNGSSPKAHPSGYLYTGAKPDVGEQNLDSTVHGFVSNVDMVLPVPHARSAAPYPSNGYKNVYPESFIAAQPRKDIGEQGVDPEVHGMVAANNMVLPIPHRRPDVAYLPNGSNPKA